MDARGPLNADVRCHLAFAVEDPVTNFLAMRTKYYDPLCRQLGLQFERTSSSTATGYAVVSGAVGPVRVFFECDRGVHAFSLGFADDESDFCGIEAIADRFPRVRHTSLGQQRLSLEEQAAFLRQHWRAIQDMFSSASAAELRAWRAARGEAYTKKMSGDT